MNELALGSEINISTFDMPEDGGWSEIDEVPLDTLNVVSIYSAALRDSVDGPIPEIENIEEFYEVYDSLTLQRCIIAEVDGEIVGAASVDLERGVPFLEGIAVDREARRAGVAGALLVAAVGLAKATGASELHARSQLSSLQANRRIMEKASLSFSIDVRDCFPSIIIDLS